MATSLLGIAGMGLFSIYAPPDAKWYVQQSTTEMTKHSSPAFIFHLHTSTQSFRHK